VLLVLIVTLVAPVVGIDPAPLCTKAEVRRALPKGTAFEVVPAPRTLVATKGALHAAACGAEGGARLTAVLTDPAIDYRERVALPDGRLVFGGTGGLVALDPLTLTTTRPTIAPPFPVDACWAGMASGEPVPAWDRHPRALGPDPKVPTLIAFERGGPCGYEAEPTGVAMIVDTTTWSARAARNVAALLVTRTGLVALGDGGPRCGDRQTRGTLWLSLAGGPFWPIPLDPREPMGIVALAETMDTKAGPTLWALTGACDEGGAARGGNLWRAPLAGEHAGAWERVTVPFVDGERGFDQGDAIVALRAHRDEVHLARAKVGDDRLSWRASRDGGVTWRASRGRAEPRQAIPRDLAATLGVLRVIGLVKTRDASWAWTSDGAFVKDTNADAWSRRFPLP